MRGMDANAYVRMVGDKISQAKSKLVVPGFRDGGQGFMYTAARIANSAKNLFFSMGNGMYEPTEALFQAFSERPGMNDVANVYGVDVVDISIAATLGSVLPYLAVERSMDKPTDLFYFQKLTAVNDAGGFTAGQDVLNPFNPISNNIALNAAAALVTGTVAAAGSPAATEVVALAKEVAKKSVRIIFKSGTTVVATGTDVNGDGIIYFNSGLGCNSATVDYVTGNVTIQGIKANISAEVTAGIDRSSQVDGANTLKVKPKTDSRTVTAESNRIVLESNFEDQAYMNKLTYDLQTAGVSMDYGQRAMKQLLDAYTYFIDLMVVRQTALTAKKTAFSEIFDLTEYALATSEASTKNDKLNAFILGLNNKLLKTCGRGPTAYLVDMEAARIMANNPMFFTPNANFDMFINGMIGTYRNVPVIRHNVLDGAAPAGANHAFVAAIHKTPDGQSAPVAYGEYLPPYSIRPAINFDNPAQFSQGLFSQSIAAEIVPELAVAGSIKYA